MGLITAMVIIYTIHLVLNLVVYNLWGVFGFVIYQALVSAGFALGQYRINTRLGI